MKFERVFSGAPWEERVGYCGALRAGDHIYVTGTASVGEEGGVHAPGDAYGGSEWGGDGHLPTLLFAGVESSGSGSCR